MTGQPKSYATRFQRHSPRVPYFHCALHNLNLTLSKASSITKIQCMLDVIRSIGMCFKYFQDS